MKYDFYTSHVIYIYIMTSYDNDRLPLKNDMHPYVNMKNIWNGINCPYAMASPRILKHGNPLKRIVNIVYKMKNEPRFVMRMIHIMLIEEWVNNNGKIR